MLAYFIISVIIFCIIVFCAVRYQDKVGLEINPNNQEELVGLLGLSFMASILWIIAVPVGIVMGLLYLLGKFIGKLAIKEKK